MTAGPRERLLRSAVALMRERGVHATGLADLLAHSGTARGSIYQHFPGGKSDLMEQATFDAGRDVSVLLDHLLAKNDAQAAITGVLDFWKLTLIESDYTLGCPILAASQSGPSESSVQAASGAVFATWVEKIADALTTVYPPDTARSIASAAVSSIEGAIAQCRSARTTQPLDDLHIALTALTDRAM